MSPLLENPLFSDKQGSSTDIFLTKLTFLEKTPLCLINPVFLVDKVGLSEKPAVLLIKSVYLRKVGFFSEMVGFYMGISDFFNC